MFKLIITTFLLATLLQAQASMNVRFRTQNPYTVAIGSHLYTVSQNPTHIEIYSTDKNVESCKIAVDSTKINFFGRIKATALSQKIVAWGVRSQEQINNGVIRRTNYVVLLLDPKACTHKVLSNLVDEVPASQKSIPAEVVTHPNSFDVFLPGKSRCSPCRYNMNGEDMVAPGQIQHFGSPTAPFHLQEIGKTNTYFYVYNFDMKALVSKLDQNYRDLGKPVIFTSTTINDLAVGYDGRKTYFGYTKIHPKKFSYLMLLNDKLDLNHFFRLPQVPNYFLYRTLTSFDSHGNSHIVLLYLSSFDHSSNVQLVRYTSDGVVIDEHEISKLESNEDYDVQSILVGDRTDCVVIHELNGGITDIKCIDMI